MSKVKGYPDAQPFNINGRRNFYKRNAWWQRTPAQNNTQPKKSGV